VDPEKELTQPRSVIESVAVPPTGAPRKAAIVERLESVVNGSLPHTLPPFDATTV
jgi:hypothetical protein